MMPFKTAFEVLSIYTLETLDKLNEGELVTKKNFIQRNAFEDYFLNHKDEFFNVKCSDREIENDRSKNPLYCTRWEQKNRRLGCTNDYQHKNECNEINVNKLVRGNHKENCSLKHTRIENSCINPDNQGYNI